MEYTLENKKILFIEDDETLLDEMSDYFDKNGNEIFAAENLKQAKNIISNESLDIIVLDVILPDGDGIEFLRKMKNSTPVIIMSSLDEEEVILSSYTGGAIDYIIKPCSMKLLEVHMVLRSFSKSKSIISSFGLELDVKKRCLTYKKKNIQLTGSEFNILHFLMMNAGKFYHSEEIYENVWRAPSLKTTTIKRHLSTLRCKLKEATKLNLIVTEFGKGYCFILED